MCLPYIDPCLTDAAINGNAVCRAACARLETDLLSKMLLTSEGEASIPFRPCRASRPRAFVIRHRHI